MTREPGDLPGYWKKNLEGGDKRPNREVGFFFRRNMVIGHKQGPVLAAQIRLRTRRFEPRVGTGAGAVLLWWLSFTVPRMGFGPGRSRKSFLEGGMNPVRRFSRFAAFILLFILASCSKPEAPTVGSSVRDQLGRTVPLKGAPNRIVSLAPSNTEILCALGLSDSIAAVTTFDNYPPEALLKPKVGGFSDPSVEQIISFSPDLVLAAPIHETHLIPQLEAKAITVLALAPRTLEDVLHAISLVGQVTGRSERAHEIVAGMEKRIRAITEKTDKISPDKKPKVVYLVWHEPLMVSGSGTFHDELIRKAGGTNIAANVREYAFISLETVVRENPDIIMAGVKMGEGRDAPLKFARTDLRLRDVSAVRKNQVFGIDSDISSRAGPRIVDALEQFAGLIHPESFK
ncbi:MAG: ABC transporter substrate-binding protein [Acidobacteriota bacterium]